MLLLLGNKLLIELEEKILDLLVEVRNIALIVKFYYTVSVHQLPSIWVDPSLWLLLFLQQFHTLGLVRSPFLLLLFGLSRLFWILINGRLCRWALIYCKFFALDIQWLYHFWHLQSGFGLFHLSWRLLWRVFALGLVLVAFAQLFDLVYVGESVFVGLRFTSDGGCLLLEGLLLLGWRRLWSGYWRSWLHSCLLLGLLFYLFFDRACLLLLFWWIIVGFSSYLLHKIIHCITWSQWSRSFLGNCIFQRYHILLFLRLLLRLLFLLWCWWFYYFNYLRLYLFLLILFGLPLKLPLFLILLLLSLLHINLFDEGSRHLYSYNSEWLIIFELYPLIYNLLLYLNIGWRLLYFLIKVNSLFLLFHNYLSFWASWKVCTFDRLLLFLGDNIWRRVIIRNALIVNYCPSYSDMILLSIVRTVIILWLRNIRLELRKRIFFWRRWLWGATGLWSLRRYNFLVLSFFESYHLVFVLGGAVTTWVKVWQIIWHLYFVVFHFDVNYLVFGSHFFSSRSFWKKLIDHVILCSLPICVLRILITLLHLWNTL